MGQEFSSRVRKVERDFGKFSVDKPAGLFKKKVPINQVFEGSGHATTPDAPLKNSGKTMHCFKLHFSR